MCFAQCTLLLLVILRRYKRENSSVQAHRDHAMLPRRDDGLHACTYRGGRFGASFGASRHEFGNGTTCAIIKGWVCGVREVPWRRCCAQLNRRRMYVQAEQRPDARSCPLSPPAATFIAGAAPLALLPARRRSPCCSTRSTTPRPPSHISIIACN